MSSVTPYIPLEDSVISSSISREGNGEGSLNGDHQEVKKKDG